MDICCSEWDKVPFWKSGWEDMEWVIQWPLTKTGMTALTMAGKKGDLIIFRFFNKKFGWIIFSHKWLLVFLYLYMYIWYTWTKWNSSISCRGGVEVERSPRIREIGVRSLVATDISRKKGIDSSTAKRSATSVSVTGPRRWPLGSCRSGCVTLKNPHCSMAMSTEQRSPAIVTSPYEWKILEWEQTNKQIYFLYYKNIDISRSSQSYCYLWLLYILQFTRMHLLFK